MTRAILIFDAVLIVIFVTAACFADGDARYVGWFFAVWLLLVDVLKILRDRLFALIPKGDAED